MLRSFLVLSICCVGSSLARYQIQEPPRPILTECGPDEIYECVNSCPLIQTCEERSLNITCSTNQVCEYRCVCKEGFFRRTEGGECISEEECGPILKCEGLERYTHCKSPCSNDTCSSIAGQRDCEIQEPCRAACICREGYFRKEEGDPCKPLCFCDEAQESHDCTAWLALYNQKNERRQF